MIWNIYWGSSKRIRVQSILHSLHPDLHLHFGLRLQQPPTLAIDRIWYICSSSSATVCQLQFRTWWQWRPRLGLLLQWLCCPTAGDCCCCCCCWRDAFAFAFDFAVAAATATVAAADYTFATDGHRLGPGFFAVLMSFMWNISCSCRECSDCLVASATLGCCSLLVARCMCWGFGSVSVLFMALAAIGQRLPAAWIQNLYSPICTRP